MKKERADQGQPANPYIRWRNIPDADFLWWVDGRDTPEFSIIFANWLAHDCRVHLVRACFDDSVVAFNTRRRNELYPARFQAAIRKAMVEKDTKRRKAKLTAAQRLFPRSKRESICNQLSAEVEQFRTTHVELLVKRLSNLKPAGQIHFLNRTCKDLRPAQRGKPRPRPKKERNPAGTATERPTALTLEEVQSDYGFQFPPPHEANEKMLLFKQELGQEAAGYFARKKIPTESLSLCRIAIKLHVSPLGKVLKEKFQTNPNELPKLVACFLQAHLKRPFYQHGWVTANRHLARECRNAAYQLSGWPTDAAGAWSQNPPAEILATMHTFCRLHRVARRDKALVSALWDFLVPGFTDDDMREHHVILAKLAAQAWPEDIKLLVQFLFQDGLKKRLGLVPQWLRDGKPSSAHRLNQIQTTTYEQQVKRHRRGERESDYFAEYEAEAGVPKPLDDTQHQTRNEAWVKRRQRTLGNLPT